MLMAMVAMTYTFADQQETEGTNTFSCGDQVSVKIEPATGYHFVQWADGNIENPRLVTMDDTKNLAAEVAVNQYTIKFHNWDGTPLCEDLILNHGDAISYTGNEPTKTATAKYTYTFSGWNPNLPNPAVATKDTTFVAQFDSTLNKYSVVFKNWNGDTLQLESLDYGTTPVFKAANPTRPADSVYSYTFTGWDKSITPVTGGVAYIAQYSNAGRTYSITVTSNDPTYCTTEGSGIYQYNSKVTITATPKDACYEFIKWSDGNTNASREIVVKGDFTYTATIQKKQYTLTVTVNDSSHAQVVVNKQ